MGRRRLTPRELVLKCKYGALEYDSDGKVRGQSCINSGEKKEPWGVGQVRCDVDKPEDCDFHRIGKKVKAK